VRFLAATNRDLRGLVDQGSFRRDLYFRLNGITLRIPPLRERAREIAGLAVAFVARASKAAGREPPAIAPLALQMLERHAWTGNIRELRNTMERAVVLCTSGPILAEHLVLDPGPSEPAPDGSGSSPSGRGLRQDVDEFERAKVLEALERAGGNQSLAAEFLGVSRRTLVARLTAYGLTKPRRR
jgi:DNA-binding NtrC family response regulator